jgi:hypothetical protein
LKNKIEKKKTQFKKGHNKITWVNLD